ncbi:MAG: TetR/AcrR family transcriptional regulator [Acidimicrobiales bacterium]
MSDKSSLRKRPGRPARVTTAQIAEAALDLGLESANIRSVAERLEMSVPGLYHHVRTREELLAMAAAHRLGALELPPDEGLDAGEWLTRYARFVFDALVAQPEVIGQIVAGTVNTMRMAQHLERFLEVLSGHGWSLQDAYDAYGLLSATVVGAAASEIGGRAADAGAHSSLEYLRRAARTLGPDDTPLLSELMRGRHRELEPFKAVEALVAVLTGRFAGT